MAIKSNATLDTNNATRKTDGREIKYGQKSVDENQLLMDHIQDILDSLDHVMTGFASSVAFAAASAASNICEVTITVKDNEGNAIAAAHMLDWWLSDASTGIGLTSTSASGTVAVKSASGTDIKVDTAKKHTRVQTKVDGTYILEITDTAKTGFYVCAKVGDKIFVSPQLVTGDYG